MGEVGVTERHLEVDLARGLRGAAGDFGEAVLEAIRQVDPCPMLAAGDGVLERLTTGLDQPGDADRTQARLDVDLEVDVSENRIVHGGESRGENAEYRRSWFLFLPGHDLHECVPLGLVGAVVDDDLGSTVALVPLEGGSARRPSIRVSPK